MGEHCRIVSTELCSVLELPNIGHDIRNVGGHNTRLETMRHSISELHKSEQLLSVPWAGVHPLFPVSPMKLKRIRMEGSLAGLPQQLRKFGQA